MHVDLIAERVGTDHVQQLFGQFLGPKTLNIGCGCQPQPGMLNLDRVGGFGAEIVCEVGTQPIPLASDSLDSVFASHVLEHIPNIIGAMREIHRVLKPGGYLIACTPHAGADGAWDDPTHVRAFTEHSWGFYDRRLYQRPNQAGHYPSPVDFCFDLIQVELVPFEDLRRPELVGRARVLYEEELRDRAKYERNIIQEVQAVLRKVED